MPANHQKLTEMPTLCQTPQIPGLVSSHFASISNRGNYVFETLIAVVTISSMILVI